MVHLEGREALEHCRQVTVGGANHLHEAARELGSGRRYEFFLAGYAAMRALDDLVDQQYLGRDQERRKSERPRVLETVDRWDRQIRRAAVGAYIPTEEDFEPLIFRTLDQHLSRSDLGAAPFLRLSKSLRRDVEEIPLHTWSQWYDYCEGAAVAPGSVFLYLLLAEETEGGGLRLPSSLRLMDEARELAHFCYFTHIVRDLGKDARADPQLLTIPEQLLQEEGFGREDFRRAAAGDRAEEDPGVRRVVTRLLDRAREHGARARQRLEHLRPRLDPARRAVLDHLHQLYHEAFVAEEARWRT